MPLVVRKPFDDILEEVQKKAQDKPEKVNPEREEKPVVQQPAGQSEDYHGGSEQTCSLPQPQGSGGAVERGGGQQGSQQPQSSGASSSNQLDAQPAGQRGQGQQASAGAGQREQPASNPSAGGSGAGASQPTGREQPERAQTPNGAEEGHSATAGQSQARNPQQQGQTSQLSSRFPNPFDQPFIKKMVEQAQREERRGSSGSQGEREKGRSQDRAQGSQQPSQSGSGDPSSNREQESVGEEGRAQRGQKGEAGKDAEGGEGSKGEKGGESERKRETEKGGVKDGENGRGEDGRDDRRLGGRGGEGEAEGEGGEKHSDGKGGKQSHTHQYNTVQAVDVLGGGAGSVRYYQTEFYRFIEAVAEEKLKLYDHRAKEEYNMKKLMLRQFERKPLSSYMMSRVRDSVVLILDNSGSMDWWAHNLRILAGLALERRDVEVYVAPNGHIEAKILPGRRVVWVSHGAVMKSLRGRKIIYVGDYDGANTPVELSFNNEVVWVCPETRYRRFRAHSWVMYSESDFRGAFLRVYSLDEMFWAFRRLLSYQHLGRVWIDPHAGEAFGDDLVVRV